MKTFYKIILIAAFFISTAALAISMVDYKVHQKAITELQQELNDANEWGEKYFYLYYDKTRETEIKNQ